jgi:hypothetical protein
MTLAELTTEFLARGFDYLSTSRAESYLSDAYLVDVCDAEDWPFLEASKEGPAPLEIADLGHIEEVLDTTQAVKLQPLRRARVTDGIDTEVGTVGTPWLYYVTGGDTVNVYQANTTDNLLVRYWKTPERLTSGATPIIPSRFHSLIVDGAVARAYEDSDDFELAQNAEEKFQRRLQKMREALLETQHDAPDDFIVVTDPEAF